MCWKVGFYWTIVPNVALCCSWGVIQHTRASVFSQRQRWARFYFERHTAALPVWLSRTLSGSAQLSRGWLPASELLPLRSPRGNTQREYSKREEERREGELFREEEIVTRVLGKFSFFSETNRGFWTMPAEVKQVSVAVPAGLLSLRLLIVSSASQTPLVFLLLLIDSSFFGLCCTAHIFINKHHCFCAHPVYYARAKLLLIYRCPSRG